jgi:hypothetical protein
MNKSLAWPFDELHLPGVKLGNVLARLLFQARRHRNETPAARSRQVAGTTTKKR